MSFLYPLFLVAALAIAIPILIHFLNFRSLKTIYFSNTQFLNNLKKSNKNVNRILHFLILLLRILFIVSLVLAFAYPYINRGIAENKALPVLNILYIDNSLSMEITHNKYTLLHEATEKAKNFVDNSHSNAAYILITNDFVASDEYILSKEQILEKLSAIRFSSFSRSTVQVLNRASQIHKLYGNYNSRLIYISDFQSIKTDRPSEISDSTFNLNIVHMKPEYIGNLSVDTAWFEEPVHFLNKKEKLNSIIHNWSENPQSVTVRMFLKDSLVSTQLVDVQGKSSANATFEFPNTRSASTSGYIEIDDEDMPFDNRLYFSIYVPYGIMIKEIWKNQPSKYIRALYNTEDGFMNLESEQQKLGSLGNINGYNLLIINEIEIANETQIEELSQYLKQGGNIIQLPDLGSQASALNNWLNTAFQIHIQTLDTAQNAVNQINYNSRLYKDVFQKEQSNLNLPVFNKLLLLDNQNPKTENLLLTLEEYPVLIQTSLGMGRFYFLATSLNPKISNFATHPLFAPTFFQIANQSGSELPTYYTIADMMGVEVAEYKSDNEKNNATIIPENGENTFEVPIQNNNQGSSQFMVEGKWLTAGNYQIADAGLNLNNFSINYPRSESNIQNIEESEILAYFEGMNLSNLNTITNQFGNNTPIQTETPLWFYTIFLALLLILVEGVLLKFR